MKFGVIKFMCNIIRGNVCLCVLSLNFELLRGRAFNLKSYSKLWSPMVLENRIEIFIQKK